LLAVWAAWIHIAWLTNYLDPRERVMRVLLLALMLVSLVMSASLLEAFDGYGLAFGGALSASLLIGQTYGLIALWRRDPIGGVFERVLIWWVPVSALLVAGGFMDGSARLVAWGRHPGHVRRPRIMCLGCRHAPGRMKISPRTY
jgi:low temperature requirement protein LtrA